jgi:hypothetical protein
MDQLQLIFDMMGTPTRETWDGFQDLKLLRTGEVTIETARKAKLRDKYQTKVSGAALNLLEKLLELDPQKRLTASRALNSRYFLADPKAPDQPEDLPPLHLEGGHFHEFQTKKKRREAKGIAEKARDAAIETGRSQKEAQDEYDEVYRDIMEKVGKEGLNAVAKFEDRKEDVDGQSKSGERKERKKDRASREMDREVREKDREAREKEREAKRAERAKEKAERKEKQREDRDKDRANRKRPEKEDGDRPRDRKSDEERRKKRKKEHEARKNDDAVKSEEKSEMPQDATKGEQLMDTEPAPIKREFDVEKEANKEAVPEELVARRESPPRSKERNGAGHGVANPVKAAPKDEVDDHRPIDREERRPSRKRRDRSRDRSHSRDREHTSKERSRERRSSRDPERRSSRDRGERRRSRERRRRSRDGERDDRDRKRRSDPEDADYPPPDWGRDRDRDMERRGRDRDPDWGRERDRDWPRDRRTPPENFNGPPPPRDMAPRDDFGPRGHYGPSRGGPHPGRGGPPPDSRGRGPPPDARRGSPPVDLGMYGPASGDIRPSGVPPRNHYGESRHRDYPVGDRRRDRSPPRQGHGRARR